MKILRNKEIKLQMILGIGATFMMSLLLFLYTNEASGIGSLVTGLVLLGIWMLLSYRRYQDIRKLTEEMDEILHGNDSLNLSRMREGDLEILRDEIQKMIVRLREQNECIQKEKKSLADSLTDISHQIRTPLTSLNLMLVKVGDPDLDEREKRKCCRDMERMLERIEWLISSLLKMAKLEAGTVVMTAEEIPVEELIKAAVCPFEIAMELRGQNFRIVQEKQKKSTVRCDRRWTEEAIGNVLKNSVEHTPEGGTIHAEIIENPLFTEISIIDSGCGIAKEDLPHLFERFYRGKRQEQMNFNFGIGLAFAKQILINQDAVITAENAKKGGAQFRIRFYKSVV